MNPSELTSTDVTAAPTTAAATTAQFLGFALLHRDEPLGDIEEIIELDSEPYCVVDTRHWTFGERRLVPAISINHIDLSLRTAETSIEPETIRAAPDFDPFRLRDDRYLANMRRPLSSTMVA